MRTFLLVPVLAIGIAAGAAIPNASGIVHRILAAAGLASAREPGRTADAKAGPPAAENVQDKAAEIRMSPERMAGQGIATATVAGGTLSRHLLVPGTVVPDPDRIARVPARVVGTVAEMRKRLGDLVRTGDVVAVLDSREVADAKSEYLAATVQADLQRTNFERQQALLRAQATAEAQFLQARATFREAQLRLDLARQKLSALGFTAAEVEAAAKADEATPARSSLRLYPARTPLAGRIVERKVDVGTRVGSEGDPADLYTVADLSSVWIELAVPTLDVSQVREGARVVVVSGGGGASGRAEGRVFFISPLLNADTRSARVIVTLPNADFAWRPGTFVTTEVEIADDAVAVRVPKAALQTVGGGKAVFVRIPEGFARRPVQLGRADDDAVEVLSGLEPGEEIAVGNTFLLKAELGKAEPGGD